MEVKEDESKNNKLVFKDKQTVKYMVVTFWRTSNFSFSFGDLDNAVPYQSITFSVNSISSKFLYCSYAEVNCELHY